MQNKPSFYIETLGCQMNERDSEIMAQLLSESALPCSDIADADIVLVNTCSIREKASQKAFSLLGHLKYLKIKKPALVIGVVGCVAQQEGKKILQRMSHVDLVMGPQNIYNLPSLLADIERDRKRIVAIEQSPTFVIPPFLPEVGSGPSHKRFVTIMQGCNNFCTYCVVPYTRGREVSRNFNEIVSEAKLLLDHGVKEITLLGQNVNSYGRDGDGKQIHTFAELLRAVAALNGLERLRFTTSNPKDLTNDLLQSFTELPVLCSHFHLPVQSGSDRVLERMNRKYSRTRYLELIDALQQYRPDIAITTDIIVGFPGETEADFQATFDLVEQVRFHGAYSFKYSDRPQAKSIHFADKVSEEEKAARLAILQKRIDEIIIERNREYLGRIEQIMVESENKGREGQWHGRTGTNNIVHFHSANRLYPGQMVDVLITEACEHSIRGELQTND
ncbi:MAG: tRNA (N6-isopentenyl adenosine(37)-C2)-methylthiotransferase MiaB [Desulfobulbaceae bacterium]|nr:tRNA (N6-isopentenyl adenosine(37)-C2)-methylthiotransferase MiaB [Desulfobulbaceae bacterium]